MKTYLSPNKSITTKSKGHRFGDERFDFIRACKHDLKGDDNHNYLSCPLCKLVQKVTKSFFELEKERQRVNREASNINRGLMRRRLLIEWSRCQAIHYAETFPTDNVDIFITKSMAYMLANISPLHRKINGFADIVKLLQRKNRMVEVGYFAAVFLQSRIRKLLAKLRVRRIMLRRFEFVPATKKKAQFFIDTKRSHKWTRLPYFLKNEPPGSPRTINRRLAALEKKGDLRMERFLKILHEKYNVEEDLFEQEDQHIAHLRQFVVFRDIVSIAMKRLALAASGSKESSIAQFHNGYRVVRLSMTAPVMSPRHLGISMVISGHNKDSSVSTASTVTNELLNHALHNLEDRALAALACDTPEAVVSKILLEDVSPTMTSIINISDDELQIWNPRLVDVQTVKNDEEITADDSSKTNHIQTIEAAKINPSLNPAADIKEVLPLAVQLRPYWPERTVNGLFRLFFFEEEFVAATQYSPIVHFPEVMKNKDTILNSLKAYAASPQTKLLVRNYLSSANTSPSTSKGLPPVEVKAAPAAHHNNSNRRASRILPKGVTPAVKEAASPYKYNYYFAPPDSLAFNLTARDTSRTPFEPSNIPDEVIMDVANKYQFVHKVNSFNQRLKRAQQNHRSKLKKQSNDSPSIASIEESNARSRAAKLKVASDEYANVEGENIYHLIKAMPESTANKGRKAPENSPEKSAPGYLSQLQKYGCSGEVKVDINSRIQLPPALSTAIGTTSSPQPLFQLVVLEVYVNLPKPTMKVDGNHPGGHNAQMHSSRDSMSVDSNSSSTVNLNHAAANHSHPNHLYSVDLHEVVGIFNCDNERAPSNLEMGLLEWDKFRQLTTASKQRAIKGKSSSSIINNGSTRRNSVSPSTSSAASVSSMSTNVQDKTWAYDTSTTGIATYRSMLQSGREFEFTILGTTPARELLEEQLPKNVKKWLGLAVL